MLEGYSKDDMAIIKEKMLKINPDEEVYHSLMDAMQKYGQNYSGIYFGLNVISLICQFGDLLSLHYMSVKFTDDTIKQLLHYLVNSGYWRDVPDKFFLIKQLLVEQ